MTGATFEGESDNTSRLEIVSLAPGPRSPAPSICAFASDIFFGASRIQEKFLVSFRAEDGAVDDFGCKSELAHCLDDAAAGGLMQLGVPDDSALSDLALAYLKLRFD